MTNHKHYDYLIVGAGLFGAVFARQAMDQGKSCLVIDRRSHTGGNIHCETVEDIRAAGEAVCRAGYAARVYGRSAAGELDWKLNYPALSSARR